MKKPFPKSVDSYGGILPYLDATAEEHNGYSSKDLVKNWKLQGGGLTVSAISKMFGVHRITARDWLTRYHRENNIPFPNLHQT